MSQRCILFTAWLAITIQLLSVVNLFAGEPTDSDDLERQFRTLPIEARRLTGPLFWMHGDENETKQRLEEYLEIVARRQWLFYCRVTPA